MWFDPIDREWKAHPDCTCGQGEDWAIRRINRPCWCHWLRPLDEHGKPIPHEVIDGMAGRETDTPISVRREKR